MKDHPSRVSRAFHAIRSAVCLSALAICASTAQAAVIHWGAPRDIAGDTDVSTNGVLVKAIAKSGTDYPTVNGVTFCPAYGNDTVSGTLSLKGIFNIDLTGAAAIPGNSWTLVDVATLNETFDPTFAVTGFTQNADVWTKPAGANVWTFRESTGVLTYTVASAFTSWIDTPAFGLTAGQKGATADPDNDGIENLLEFVLNGNPAASDPAILPTLNTSGTTFVFTFTRRELSASDTTQVFQYGSDLGGWTSLNITAPTAGQVALGTPAGGLQTVTISIPKALAGPGGGLFGRLRVTQP